ncbi:uncharacterized protein [Nicotiana tomentosiformis]|uniref:uncharacterized protein n=1 Tax=Nicotiana tomentosiformis TaxID=4098 RepID=UPI00388C63F4
MVRTHATGSVEQTLAHTARAERGRDRGRGRRRGRGQGRAHVAARAPVRVTIEEPPVAPARLISVAPNISQARGGDQTPTARTSEQHVYIGQPEFRPGTSEEEQERLERLKRYSPPTFGGTTTKNAQKFLEKCHHILHTMGIMEVSGVAFTTFQLSGAAYRWWRAYEEGRPADATPPTWAQFSEIFLKEFVPQTLQDAWCT